MNFSRPSIPSLAWSSLCIIAGITFSVLAKQNYTKWSKKIPATAEICAEVNHRREVNRRHLSTLQEWQKKSVGMDLTEQQISKLTEETAQIKQAIWKEEKKWENLAKQLDQQKTLLLQAQAEMQFAKSELRSAGVNQKDIENYISRLEEQLQKNTR